MKTWLFLVGVWTLAAQTSAFAKTDSGDGWAVIRSSSVTGNTPETVKSALDKTSDISWLRDEFTNSMLAGVNPAIIIRINANTSYLKYEGTTVCLPNDPRLFITASSGSVDYSDGSDIAWTGPGESIGDPCSPNFKRSVRTITRSK